MDISAIEVLQSIPMFAGLESAPLEAMAARAATHTFTTGQLLFHEGDTCEGLFLLIRGAVKIFKTSPSGRQLTLAVETAPATVAELPLFDGGPYPASAQAIGTVSVLFIHKQMFRTICLQHPQVPLRALAMVGRRLRGLVGLIESVTFGSVRQRLARLLLELSDRAGGSSFPLPGTHQEIALNLGTVREVISRNLNRFQADGLIRLDHRELVVLDRPCLEREAEAEI